MGCSGKNHIGREISRCFEDKSNNERSFGMDAQGNGGLLRFFQDMPDPRGKNKLHLLTDLMVLAICAVICGADGWVQVEQFAKAKQKFFATFLQLPHGIPSHDTLGRVFARLNPDSFEQCFMAWTGSLAQTSGGKLINLDGKAIRRSFEHAWDKSGMTHLVSAFVSANRMVFGQLAVQDKSNEITAIPKLLELLDVRGATVTIDAIGCQKNIAQKIMDGGGDYYLAVKENQPQLHQKVKALLDEAVLDSFAGMEHDFFQEVCGDHGRIETRRVWCTTEIQWLGPLAKDWPGLKMLVAVEAVREVGGKSSSERRYYIASSKTASAKQAAQAIRGHWGIENQLHWILDMSFNEDGSRIRKGHGAENFSRLRRIALNLLQQETSRKVGIKTKRLIAGWDHDYLLNLLTG
jgi:predicted transposase YbfD/YdcC